uniref:histidine kinase n=1 Tax=Emiliania huxleyi TaxID=2903 RepID=A0A7S3W200_EMIHU
MSAPNFCFAHAAGASDQEREQERGYQPNQWPCHPDDEQRIAALHDFHLLDTDFEEPFDRLATLAARHFDVPIALVSLVDTDRQWFKAAEGLPVRQTCRDAAFCTHAIMPGAPTIFEINDAAEDKRFCDNPLVTGDPWIRYYAGRALVCDGQPIGTLCLIDRKPRPPLDDSQRKELIMFADMVVDLVYRRQLAKQYEIVQSQLYKKTDELQAKNRELSDLVDTANAPIFAVDRHLVVTAWNQKVSQLTSIPADFIKGASIRCLASGAPSEHVDTLEVSFRALQRAVNGERVECFEMMIQSKVHGRQVLLQVSAEPQLNEDGRPIGAVCIGEDVIARRRIEEKQREMRELQRSNEQKDHFLACMSHEMRTPLNGLLGMLQLALLSEECANTTELKRQLQQARNSGTLLLNLINDLLDTARLRSGQLSLEPCHFELLPTVRESVDVLRHRASEKGLRFICEMDPALEGVRVHSDPTRLSQVLLNLLWNAIKFTAAGEVRLTASQVSRSDEACGVRIEVSDTGIGIAGDMQEAVFECGRSIGRKSLTSRLSSLDISGRSSMSERAPSSPRTPTGSSPGIPGAGLGLYISRQLVVLLGGTLALSSELAVGTSVSLELTLPIATSGEEEPARPPSARSPQSPLPRFSVLLVEDNDFNVEVCKQLLEHMGQRVSVAMDGRDAVGAVVSSLADGAHEFDVILMDCDMPVMNGFEACAAFRFAAPPAPRSDSRSPRRA